MENLSNLQPLPKFSKDEQLIFDALISDGAQKITDIAKQATKEEINKVAKQALNSSFGLNQDNRKVKNMLKHQNQVQLISKEPEKPTEEITGIKKEIPPPTTPTEKILSKGYTDFTHRLSTDQKAELDLTLQSVKQETKFNENYQKVLEKIQANDWTKTENAQLFELDNFDYYLLIALQKGDISIEQFTSCQMIKAAQQETPDKQAKAVDLFLENGEINPEVRKLIEATTQTPDQYNTNLQDSSKKPAANKEQIDAFFKAMRSKPKSEQKLYIMKDTKDWTNAEKFVNSMKEFPNTGILPDYDLMTISQSVKIEGLFNLFGSIRSDKTMLVPSFTMMQTMLDVIAGKNALQMRPTMGETTDKDIHKDIPKAQRDFAVPMKGFELPKTADGLTASPYDFMFHDFYHSYLASHILPNHREAFFELACDVLEIIKEEKDPKLLEYFGWAFESIIDLELSLYRPEVATREIAELAPAELFWHSMQLFQLGIVVSRPTKERRLGEMDTIATKFNESGFWKRAAKKLKPRMDKWQKDYGIDQTSLKNSWEKTERQLRSQLGELLYLYPEILTTQPLNIMQQELCN